MEDISPIFFIIAFILFYLAYIIKNKMDTNIQEKEKKGKEYLESLKANYLSTVPPAKTKTEFKCPEQKEEKPKLIPSFTIIYATQSGTSFSFGKALKSEAKDKYNVDVPLVNISEMEDPEKFNNIDYIVFIVSTYGDGDPTDDSVDFNDIVKEENFWERLTNKQFKYTVFGCGSQFYPKFNEQAKFIDNIFKEHGYNKICDIALGDDSKDINKDFRKWKKEIFWPKFLELVNSK